MKVGLISGSGDLPLSVTEGTVQSGHEIVVAALEGFAETTTFSVGSRSFGLAEFGGITKFFKKQNCTHVCLAGNVERPDFKNLKPDLKGLKHLPGAVMAAKEGDDSLMRYILETFEKEGFTIISPQELCDSLLLPSGNLGAHSLSQEHRDDAEKACKIASTIGGLDIGQGAVVCRGLVLAVEAQEGTDAMLERVAALPQSLRGTPKKREGLLAKMVKPGQETRVDLPTIGPKTVELASKAGLAGIVAEGGRAFVMQRDDVIRLANEYGLFVAGLPPLGQ